MINLVNVGTLPNDGTGDNLRVAMQKINANYGTFASTDLSDYSTFLSDYALTSSLSSYALASSLASYVLASTTVNGKALTGNISLASTDLSDHATFLSGYALTSALGSYALASSLSSYVPNSRTINGIALTGNISLASTNLSDAATFLSGYALTSALNSYVPTSRTVNGLALTGNISLASTNLSDAATFLSGYALTSALNSYVPTSRTVNGLALTGNISLASTNLSDTANLVYQTKGILTLLVQTYAAGWYRIAKIPIGSYGVGTFTIQSIGGSIVNRIDVVRVGNVNGTNVLFSAECLIGSYFTSYRACNDGTNVYLEGYFQGVTVTSQSTISIILNEGSNNSGWVAYTENFTAGLSSPLTPIVATNYGEAFSMQNLRVNGTILMNSGYNCGSVTLVAGSATVSTAAITSTTVILLTSQSGAPLGWYYISARSVGISFTIKSTSSTDTSVVGWMMFNVL